MRPSYAKFSVSFYGLEITGAGDLVKLRNALRKAAEKIHLGGVFEKNVDVRVEEFSVYEEDKAT